MKCIIPLLQQRSYGKELLSFRSRAERDRIAALKKEAHSLRTIAAVLGISHSTLSERREDAVARAVTGHWEGDTVVSGKKTGSRTALVVFVERETRLVTARLIPDLKPASFTAAAVQALGDKQAVTLTLDYGQENRRHRDITLATGAEIYFTDPYSSWQKGSVEHANKLLRAYLPKGCDLGQFGQGFVEAACARLNKRPRKILGYKSALQFLLIQPEL